MSDIHGWSFDPREHNEFDRLTKFMSVPIWVLVKAHRDHELVGMEVHKSNTHCSDDDYCGEYYDLEHEKDMLEIERDEWYDAYTKLKTDKRNPALVEEEYEKKINTLNVTHSNDLLELHKKYEAHIASIEAKYQTEIFKLKKELDECQVIRRKLLYGDEEDE